MTAFISAPSTLSHHRQRSLGTLCAAVLAFAAFASPARAQLQWDPALTPTTPSGGTGTWTQAATANWSDGTNDVLWDSNVAVFGGTAGTVTISGGVTASGVTFNTDGYTITASTLTLTGAGTITTGPGIDTIASVIAVGSVNVVKAGSGTLILSGTNTFTSGISITAGTVSVTTSGNLGAGGITLDNGGTLATNQTAQLTIGATQGITIGNNGGTIDNRAAQKLLLGTAGALTGSGTLTRNATANNTLANNLSIAAANVGFTGAVILNGGATEISQNGLGNGLTAGNSITVNTNGELAVNNHTLVNPLFINGGVVGGDNGTSTLSGPVAVGGNASVRLGDFYQNTNRNLNITGNLSGGSGFTLATINNGNTATNYTGQILTLNPTAGDNSAYTGTLSVTSGHNLVLSTANAAALGVGGVFLINTDAARIGGVGVGYDFAGTPPTFTNSRTGGATTGGVFGINLALPATTTVNLATLGGGGMFLGSQTAGSYLSTALIPDGTTYRLGGGTGTLTFPNVTLTGANSVVVGDARTNGSGTVVVTANQTYTGTTTVNGGTYQVGNGGTTGAIGAGNVTLGAGTLAFRRSDNVSFPNQITATSPTGTVAINGGATVTLTNIANALGGISFNTTAGGILDIGANDTIIGQAGTGGALIQAAVNGTINATGGGRLKLNSNGGDIGAAAGVTLTINSVITNGTGSALDFFNNGGGVVVLNGLNTYTGVNNIQNAVVQVSNIGSVGSASSNLGAQTTAGNATLSIGGSATSTLRYVGTGETTNRVINLAGTTFGAALDQSGTGLLKFTSNTTATGAGVKSLFLQGSTTGTGEFAGIIANGTSTTGVTKNGTGTWTLSAANTYTGPTSVAQGTLNVTGSLAATDPIAFSTAPGGVLNFAQSAGTSQTLGALSYTASGNGIAALTYAGSGTNTLTFASIARSAGSAGTLASVGGVNGTTNRVVITSLGTTAGLVNPGVYFATTTSGLGATYAYNDAAGFIRGVAYGSDANTQTIGTSTTSISSAGGANVQTTAAVTAQSTDTFTTLNLAGTSATAANNSFTLAASQTLTVGSILKTGGSAATISGGTGLSNASGGDYLVRVDAATDNLTISSPILANGTNALVKTGAGTLTLTNTSASTFTGAINVYNGTLAFAGNNGAAGDPLSLGAGSKTITIYNNATIRPTSNANPTGTTGTVKSFVVSTGGATFDVPTGVSFTLDDAGQFSGTGDLTVTGLGAVILATQTFTYTGNVTVANSGTLRLSNVNVLGTAAGATGRSITVNTTGTLDVQATGFTQQLVLNGGSLISGGTGSYVGPVTLLANSNVGGTGTLTVSGNITGAFGLTKTGTGTTILSGINTYTGPTTVSAGTLRFATQSALYNGTPASVTNTSVVVANGATFALNVGGPGEFTAADITNLGTNSGGFASGSVLGLDTTNAGGTFTAPAITLINAGAGVTKLGAGTLVLSGGNTYTGTTTVLVGTVQASTNGVLPAGNAVTVTATGAAQTVNYDFNGFTQTVGAVTLGGTTTTSRPQLLGAGSTVTLNGNVTFSATNNPLGGIVSVSNLDFGAGNRTFNVGLSTSAGTLANPDLTVSSNLSNGTLTKTGTGVLLLTGNINLTSLATTAGIVGITPTTALNTTPVTVNGGTFDLGGTTQNAANFTFTSGAIQNGTLTTTNFLKQGPGTLTLGVATTASTVTINQGLVNTTSNPATPSTVNLNFAAVGAPSTDLFSPTASLTLGGPANTVVGGGQLTLTGAAGGTNSQTFASTLIDGGASYAVLTLNATPGTLALNLGTLTRNVGGTFDITLPAGTQSAANGVVVSNAGVGGTLVTSAVGTTFATVGGNDFAAYSTDSVGNIVGASVAGAGQTSLYTTASSAATFSGNADITASFTATTGSTVNTIRFNTGALTLTLAGTNTITNGAVLFGSGTSGISTITGGTIVPGAGQELVFINNKPNTLNVIGSVIADVGAAATAVTYRGNPNGGTTGSLFNITVNNTYTGPTYITNGRVATQGGLTNNTPFGTGANAIVYVDGTQDGQFFNSQSTTISNPFVVVGTGLNENGTRSGVLRFGSSSTANPALSGSITLVGDASIGNTSAASGAGYGLISGNILTSNVQNAASFALTKVGAGVIRLIPVSGSNNQTATNLAAGVLVINADGGLGATTAPLTFTGSSSLQFFSALTLPATRPIVINSGVNATIDTSLTAVGTTSTINSVISGAGNLIKLGLNGTTDNPLTLSGVNTFTGNVTVSTGSLVITNSGALGTGTKTVTIIPTTNPTSLPGLRLDGSAGNITLPASFSFTTSFDAINGTPIANAGAVVNVAGNNTILGNFTLTSGGGGTTLLSNAGTLTIGGNITANITGRGVILRGNGNGALNGVISDGLTAQLTVTQNTSTGTWALNGANSYAGTTAVQTGTLQVGNARGLGYGGVSVTAAGTSVTAGATLNLNGTAGINELITLNGTGIGANGSLVNNAANTTAVIANGVAAGSITGGSLGSGSGYSTPPAVTVAGGGGTGATAVASLGVSAASFTIAGGTTVYSVAPTVAIGGGNGGATATANLTGGVVTSITITNAGINFTTTPTISFSGGTVTTAGTNPTGSGNAANFVVSGIAFTNPGTGYTSAPTVTFASGATTATGTAQLSGVALATASSVGGVGNIQIDGVVSGAGLLTKVGTGTLTMTAANTYTGGTTLSAGTLLVNGQVATSGTGTGAVTVNGGTFGGTGRAAGAITVNSGGTLTAGDPAINSGTGTLTAGSNVTMASGSALGVRVITAGAAFTGSNFGASGTPGTDNNFLAIIGNYTLPGTGLTVNIDGTGANFDLTGATTYSYKIAQVTGTVSPLVAGTPFTSANFQSFGFIGSNYSLNTDGTGGVYVNFAPVPEPATVFGLAAGGLLVGRLIRRRWAKTTTAA